MLHALCLFILYSPKYPRCITHSLHFLISFSPPAQSGKSVSYFPSPLLIPIFDSSFLLPLETTARILSPLLPHTYTLSKHKYQSLSFQRWKHGQTLLPSDLLRKEASAPSSRDRESETRCRECDQMCNIPVRSGGETLAYRSRYRSVHRLYRQCACSSRTDAIMAMIVEIGGSVAR